MKAYNHFSGEQRNKAQRWLNAEIASGRLTRPKICMACGNGSIVDMHAEDYSEPFKKGKTDEFHLCFSCHLSVHCRFREPKLWDRYRMRIGDGFHFHPFTSRNFPLFIDRFRAKDDEFELYLRSAMGGGAPVPREYRPLDIIDGWLLAHTGKGWR